MNSKTISILIGAGALIIIIVAAIIQFSKPASENTSMTPQPQSEEAPQPQAIQNEDPSSPQAQPNQEQPAPTPSEQVSAQEEFDPSKQYTATLKTEKGDIVIELNKGQTPKTVENFVTLTQKNFYDGTIFHRTIKGFMIQGGDPKGDGTGGPGYRFDDEPFTGEYTRGTVAMANAGPNTNGSQFFIMHQDYPLPKNYVIFGHVIKGLDVLDAIATAPTTGSPMGEQSKPVTPVKILSAAISER